MSEKDVPASGRTASRSFDELRRRAQERLWWSSARIALRRGPTGTPLRKPNTVIGTAKPA